MLPLKPNQQAAERGVPHHGGRLANLHPTPLREEERRVSHGEVRHSFYTPEFVQYHRSPLWYLGAGIFSLLIVAFGVLTQSLTFVLAYLLFVAVYFLIHHHEAGLTEVALTQYGVRVGDEFFPYGEIKNFWIVYKPPFVADLKLHVMRRWQPVITIHVFGQDPLVLRALLTPHVPELPERGEHLTDLIVRALKL